MVITIQIEILENLIRTNKIGNWDPFTSFFLSQGTRDMKYMLQ